MKRRFDGERDYGARHPYTLSEAKKVLEKHVMDPYHRDLMQWLVDQLDTHRAERLHLETKAYADAAQADNERLREEVERLRAKLGAHQ